MNVLINLSAPNYKTPVIDPTVMFYIDRLNTVLLRYTTNTNAELFEIIVRLLLGSTPNTNGNINDNNINNSHQHSRIKSRTEYQKFNYIVTIINHVVSAIRKIALYPDLVTYAICQSDINPYNDNNPIIFHQWLLSQIEKWIEQSISDYLKCTKSDYINILTDEPPLISPLASISLPEIRVEVPISRPTYQYTHNRSHFITTQYDVLYQSPELTIFNADNTSSTTATQSASRPLTINGHMIDYCETISATDFNREFSHVVVPNSVRRTIVAIIKYNDTPGIWIINPELTQPVSDYIVYMCK